jgi:ubiquinone/menaquinone biosynthesis C-methylase UbiE
MCVLHHVEKPEQVFKELRRVLKVGGTATIYLSCDPSILVRLIRKFTVSRAAKNKGFQGYPLLISREHRNHFYSLNQMIKYSFRNDTMQINYFPFVIKSWNLNTFAIFHIVKEANK